MGDRDLERLIGDGLKAPGPLVVTIQTPDGQVVTCRAEVATVMVLGWITRQLAEVLEVVKRAGPEPDETG